MAAIPTHAKIFYITGIFEGTDGDPRHDFTEGDVIGWSTDDPEFDGNYSTEVIYSNVYMVGLSDAGAAEFHEAGWDNALSSPFWVSERDAKLVPDNVDAAVRALYALTDEVVDASLLKEMTDEQTEKPAA